MADDALQVTDEPALSRFSIDLDGQVAELVYERDGDLLVLVHTGVPEELGGRGIGGLLVQKAVDVAAEEGLRVRPDCPYAKAWLDKHPDQAARITIV